MQFSYQVRTGRGEVQSGIIEASSKEAAFEGLKSRGLYVTSLEQYNVPIYAKRIAFLGGVPKKEVVAFSRQLAIMLKSKVPLVEVLHTLSRQTRNKNLQDNILGIAQEIEGGIPLSKALGNYPKVFSVFYVNMIKSGEATGKLTEVFLYLADYLEKDYKFRGKIVGAMIYPAFIFVLFIAVAVVMLTVVIPQLTVILKESGQDLPFITKVVVGISEAIQHNGIFILILFLALGGIFYWGIKTPRGKRLWDQFLLKIPLVSSLIKQFYLSRIALNLSTLISGGLPIAQSLEITGDVVGNEIYKEIIHDTKEGVKRGETISSVLEKRQEIISPFFFQMVVVGEKTGTLDSSLNNAVEFYEEEVDRVLEGLIKILEPLFIIALAVIVGGLVAAVLIPMYSGISGIS